MSVNSSLIIIDGDADDNDNNDTATMLDGPNPALFDMRNISLQYASIIPSIGVLQVKQRLGAAPRISCQSCSPSTVGGRTLRSVGSSPTTCPWATSHSVQGPRRSSLPSDSPACNKEGVVALL